MSKTLWKTVNWLDRQDIVELLEGIGIACYDDEPLQLLKECLVENVESGNIDESQLEA
jgi:hypothetical protein